jgi:hypothetical protein
MRKIILGVAVWYFLILGGGSRRIGPFPSQLKCDTYRMRISRTQATSNCVQTTKKK